MTPTCAKPWSSDCNPVSVRSNFSSCIAAASALDVTNASALASPSSSAGMARGDRGGPAPQRRADPLRDPRRPGRPDDHFPAVLLLEAQRLFERIGVRLVHL